VKSLETLTELVVNLRWSRSNFEDEGPLLLEPEFWKFTHDPSAALQTISVLERVPIHLSLNKELAGRAT
jgi:hypothetical protein